MRLKQILLITGNPGKANEFQKLLPGVKMEHRSIDLVEIQSLSAQEVGFCKAQAALLKLSKRDQHLYDAVLTDDTSLAFAALGQFPGALVKFCLEALGQEGLVHLLAGKEPTATAVCCLSLGLVRSNQIMQFKGGVTGKIQSSQGESGFGWDPIFYPENSTLSFGQMSPIQKNQCSHRAAAAKALLHWLNTD